MGTLAFSVDILAFADDVLDDILVLAFPGDILAFAVGTLAFAVGSTRYV